MFIYYAAKKEHLHLSSLSLVNTISTDHIEYAHANI